MGLTVEQTDKIPKNQVNSWNSGLKKLMASLDQKIKNFLPQMNSPKEINQLMLLSIMNLDWQSTSTPTLTWPNIQKTAETFFTNNPNPLDNGSNNKILLLTTLTGLQTINAVSIINVSEKHPDKGINFEMIYREIENRKLKMDCSKNLHLKAFQQLIEKGLLLPLKAAD